MRGTAFTFGEDINTDLIMPSDVYSSEGRYTSDHEAASQYIFEPIREGFADEIDDGDIIVAGPNFGSGSGRDSAPATIQAAGIGAVIAESFARIFYRNAIAMGLPVIACPGITELVTEGDELEVDIEANIVRNLTTGEEIPTEPLPPEIQTIFEMGGMKGFIDEGYDTLRLQD